MMSPYKTMRWEKNGWMNYSFPACLTWLEHAGQKRYGMHFKVQTKDHGVLYKLLVYAIGDKENMIRLGLNPDKGLLVVGPVGCGKTSLMYLLNNFFPKEKRYIIHSSREITFSFVQQGYQLISKYTTSSYQFLSNNYCPKVYCFDDVGVERPVHYFGNECNVMAEILLSRYDHFVNRKMLTHLTSNLSASELERIYGNRLRSRMREMFNLISFDKQVGDKRQ
ncbi:ATPase [Carboxylicivirga sp. N1Y90]|uniref:ATP-binding protein n=1 Tax=Carboxylicivirga fragile TaxID=3417571 RepID=UPI003D340259|nr:ATP-binding protein [Marinilabiliaceae bacterium N1Y90]